VLLFGFTAVTLFQFGLATALVVTAAAIFGTVARLFVNVLWTLATTLFGGKFLRLVGFAAGHDVF